LRRRRSAGGSCRVRLVPSVISRSSCRRRTNIMCCARGGGRACSTP